MALPQIPEKRGALPFFVDNPFVDGRAAWLTLLDNVWWIHTRTDGIQTPGEFLAKIGRNMSEHESKLGETWEDLWRRDSESLKAAGVTAPKDRK